MGLLNEYVLICMYMLNIVIWRFVGAGLCARGRCSNIEPYAYSQRRWLIFITVRRGGAEVPNEYFPVESFARIGWRRLGQDRVVEQQERRRRTLAQVAGDWRSVRT